MQVITCIRGKIGNVFYYCYILLELNLYHTDLKLPYMNLLQGIVSNCERLCCKSWWGARERGSERLRYSLKGKALCSLRIISVFLWQQLLNRLCLILFLRLSPLWNQLINLEQVECTKWKNYSIIKSILLGWGRYWIVQHFEQSLREKDKSIKIIWYTECIFLWFL